MQEQITLFVGEKKKISTGFLTSFTIMYCGMPNENTFSIGLRESFGNQGYALNLFYPRGDRTIKLLDKEFSIFDATPEKIILQPIAKNPFSGRRR
jgi:hypothetical protein